jgi:hypothetical protein
MNNKRKMKKKKSNGKKAGEDFTPNGQSVKTKNFNPSWAYWQRAKGMQN